VVQRLPAGDGSVRLTMFGWLSSAGSLLDFSAPNIFRAGYEFEGDPASIS